MSNAINYLDDLNSELSKNNNDADKIIIQVGSATCENAAGAENLEKVFEDLLEANGSTNIIIKKTGCTGRCSVEPIVSVYIPNEAPVSYQNVSKEKASIIFQKHVLQKKALDGVVDDNFLKKQTRIALRNCGLIDPENLSDYLKNDGYKALANILDKNDQEWVINELIKSGLRGRGGGGFSTGQKWKLGYESKHDKVKYIVCNADEGDPGAFMDRSILEGDPFSIIEGMTVAGFAISANYGYIYVRAEYPLAIERIQKAIDQAKANGLLGDKIFGTKFSFDLEIRLGAGAFVCGEETALMLSIEGKRGQPKVRPPYPTYAGLWGHPTVINNVETFANISPIFVKGSEWFSSIGTEKSKGTKVFALAGKVKNTGLVEVPMGTTLREVIYDIGGGIQDDKQIKAVQTGGPSGGSIPASKLDTVVDYDSLTQIGSMMGSGGMIVLDESDCMVATTQFFLQFTQDESCGKCTPCREGTLRMLEILDRITKGEGQIEDIDKLERLAKVIKKSSLCGLGNSAPNPVLSALTHFKDEFVAHIIGKRCPTKKCKDLITYMIEDNCIGCTLCAKNCPVSCISGKPKTKHVIDQSECIKCGECFNVCKFKAITKN